MSLSRPSRTRLSLPPRRRRSGRPPTRAASVGRASAPATYTYRPARSRSPYPLATVIVAVLGLALIGWSFTWGGDRDSAADAAASEVSVEPVPERDPTPFFASYRSLQLCIPIDPGAVTAVAFHQAAGEHALAMTSLVPDADMDLANELHATPVLETGEDYPSTTWMGSCLRLWRSNRGGEPNTAADIGADAGTAVWAPVTGTVVAVRPYVLYGAYDDYEIHIRPDAWPDIDLVLIHVDDVSVEPGDRVLAGATRIAAVRLMSDKIDMQLGEYTANGGDHVHLQLNEIVDPDSLAGPEES